MKKILTIITIFCLSIGLSSIAMAQDSSEQPEFLELEEVVYLDITPAKIDAKIERGGEAGFTTEITNNLPQSIKLDANIQNSEGEPISFLNSDSREGAINISTDMDFYNFEIASGETKSVTFDIDVNENTEVGDYQYFITWEELIEDPFQISILPESSKQELNLKVLENPELVEYNLWQRMSNSERIFLVGAVLSASLFSFMLALDIREKRLEA